VASKPSKQKARWLERAAAAAILLLPVASVGLRCGLSSEVPFIWQQAEAPWIMAPLPVSAKLQQWGELEPPVTSFSRRFPVSETPAAASLRLRAFGSMRVWLNGRELPEAHRGGSRGRQEVVLDAAPWLRPGQNELRVDVANARGPALLSLRSEGLEGRLASGPAWSVRVDERVYAEAIVADDTRPNPGALGVETPREALVEKADTLLLLFALGGLGFLLGRRLFGGRAELGARVASAAMLGGASIAWLFLYFAKAARIPAAVGFDARHHLSYVDHLLEHGELPLAAAGWSTYHPPLFYAASALVEWLGGGAAALKALPLLSGLGVVWMAWLLARRLFPEAPALAPLAGLFAATLPVNLYSASYFSNEALHAFLASAALVAAVDLLLAEGPSTRRLVLAAALLGLAALTKFTVLVTVPVVLFFLAWKLLLVEREAPARVAGGLALFAGVFLLVAGWFYARSWLRYGTPILGNWALPGEDQVWWQQPGFHTLAYYARFGEALVHPYLAGFHSFWDSLYSTFWGDGFIGGRIDPHRRHSFWDYGFMSAGYWIALPATLLLGAGGLRLLREALGEGPARRRLALGCLATAVYAGALAFLALTLQLPFFAQPKAAYLLMLAGPLALAFAAGFAGLDGFLAGRGWLPARVALYGWLGLYAGALFLAYAA